MSRTYRRLRGNQKYSHYLKRKWEGTTRRPDLDVEVSRVRELRRHHSDNGWSRNVDRGDMVNVFETRPRRAQFRQFIANVFKTYDLESIAEPLERTPFNWWLYD